MHGRSAMEMTPVWASHVTVVQQGTFRASGLRSYMGPGDADVLRRVGFVAHELERRPTVRAAVQVHCAMR